VAKEKLTEDTPAPDESETPTLDFSTVTVNLGGRATEIPWPSPAAKAAGVVACKNGHPNIPHPTTGEISCGCGSTEVGEA
jgi:hypothetical protein